MSNVCPCRTTRRVTRTMSCRQSTAVDSPQLTCLLINSRYHSSRRVDAMCDSCEPAKKKRRSSVDVGAVAAKLAKHVRSDKKLGRACALLRQIVESESLTESTAGDVYEVLHAISFKKGRVLEAWARDAVMPLFASVEKRIDVWSGDAAQGVRCMVLEAKWANELATDDTYQFTAAARMIETTMGELFAAANATALAVEGGAAECRTGTPELSPREADAVLSCLRVAQSHFAHQWARSSVTALFKKASLNRERFPAAQRTELDAMSTQLQAVRDGADRKRASKAWLKSDSQAMTHPLRRF